MAKKKAAKKVARKAAKKASTAKRATKAAAGRVVVENVNVPGYRTSVDAVKYEAMQKTMMGFLPRSAPGMTQAEMMAAAREKAPRDVFPGGDKSEWWMKTVQLDQEAKGTMKRSDTKPLRWWRS